MATRKLFESTVKDEYPSVDDLLDFFHSRVSLLEVVGDSRKLSGENSSNSSFLTGQNKSSCFNRFRIRDVNHPTTLVPTKSAVVCPCCKDVHSLVSCAKFKGWSLEARSEWARKERFVFVV